MKNVRYILEGKKPVPCSDLQKWGEWIGTPENRRIEWTDIEGGFISTVFLGIDHNFHGSGDPVLYETLVQQGGFEHMERYSSYDEAVKGHKKYVKKYGGKLPGENQEEGDWNLL